MPGIGLLLDSTTVLPQDYAEAPEVTILPVPIHGGGREYRDGIDLTEEQFIQLLETLEERPSTAVPGVGEFVSWYERLLKRHSSIIYLAPSLHLSGLFNTAVQAAKAVGQARVVAIDPQEGSTEDTVVVRSTDLDGARTSMRHLTAPVIIVMNTGFVAGGTALIAIGALDAIHHEADLDQVVQAMAQAKLETELYFILNRLDYVVDRVGQLQAFLGTLLKIKPVLAIHNGLVVDVAKTRGEGKARRQMLELVKEKAGDRAIDALVLHSLAPEEAQDLATELRNYVRVRRSWISGIGCTVSRYTGRGGLGIAFMRV